MMFRYVIPFLILGGLVAGCDSNPTNAPDKQAVEDANKSRFDAIDKDPSMTPQQKELMKSKLGGVKQPSTR